jgi:hypothetical protein
MLFNPWSRTRWWMMKLCCTLYPWNNWFNDVINVECQKKSITTWLLNFLRSSSYRSRIRTVTKFRENTKGWGWIKCWKFKWTLRNFECSYVWTHYSYWWSWIFFLWNVGSKWLPKRKRAKNTDNVYRMGESHGDLCKRAVNIVLHLLLSNPTPIGNWVITVYASSEFEETIALLLGPFCRVLKPLIHHSCNALNEWRHRTIHRRSQN